MSHVLQFFPDGRLRHLLSLDGLPASVLEDLLDRAQAMLPHAHSGTALRGRQPGRTLHGLGGGLADGFLGRRVLAFTAVAPSELEADQQAAARGSANLEEAAACQLICHGMPLS